MLGDGQLTCNSCRWLAYDASVTPHLEACLPMGRGVASIHGPMLYFWPILWTRKKGRPIEQFRLHENPLGGRRPLRSSDAALEPQDEALYVRRTQRHPHTRSPADGAALG